MCVAAVMPKAQSFCCSSFAAAVDTVNLHDLHTHTHSLDSLNSISFRALSSPIMSYKWSQVLLSPGGLDVPSVLASFACVFIRCVHFSAVYFSSSHSVSIKLLLAFDDTRERRGKGREERE